MRIIIAKDYNDMSKKAANMVAAQILLKPNSVLGLATGSTPVMTYKYLIKLFQDETISFCHVVTVNLDEYIGLSKEHPNSYHFFMQDIFFNHVDIKLENIYIPDGMAMDLETECIEYENKIQKNKGIDLQILGIGSNGHIGFNEPDLKFEGITHCINLDDETIKANARFFEKEEEVPRRAITMGVKTIMNARKIILLANGSEKAKTVFNAIHGKIDPALPASILQLHPDVTFILDREAAYYINNQ
ncbi:glucosamine-6-phosphate deaminase [Alkalibaculum sp. M08DMB]|uniref:Glucosamine-6-phosphate deaminase n=1 Tax=Alkalibaculum sporogenes TaxID=2655001 RepID=A0A6A7K843_9FIRM|nr:glucosamine-6-phosphate deaminase [Alkalibaculum sporogenes]MPW25610.1 glucosamine-6-phosphate deaminase [Alkalibaculum sporogenes]